MITADLRVNNKLCVHCGACSEVCPVGAIELTKDKFGVSTPYIKDEICVKCGLCRSVCPVEAYEHTNYSDAIMGKRFKELLSPLERCWSAASYDEDTRYKASSAGVARTLARHSLNKSKVDAVVSLAENPINGLSPSFDVFTNESELHKLANSKYCPVSLEGVIRAISEKKNVKNVLFIGLPCHIRAINKAFKCATILKGLSINSIGLFCKKTKDMRYAHYLAARLKCEKGLYPKFQFRGCGWPGRIKIEFNGKERQAMFNTAATCSFPWKWYLFSPDSCLFCYDSFARESDVAVGDPWLPRYIKDPANSKGASFVVAHTKFGLDLVEGCEIINKSRIDPDEVVGSQSIEEITDKISCAKGRLQILLGQRGGKVRWSQRINAVWFLYCKWSFESIFSNKFFVTLPEKIFKILSRLPQRLLPR